MLSTSMVLAAERVNTISKILPQYKWYPLEMNENLKESVAVIDAAVKELMLL